MSLRILESSKYHRVIEGTNESGRVFRAFECRIDPDDPAYLAWLYADDYDPLGDRLADEARDAAHRVQTKRLDRFDRRESQPHTVQLGRRVNRIPASARRRPRLG